MKERYTCPKCRCGCLFENKNKLVCLNCGAEVSAASAKGVRHEHSYTTYTVRDHGKPTQVARPAVWPTSVPVRTATTFPATAGKKKPKKNMGCLIGVLIYFLLGGLVSLITRLF